MRVYGGKAPWPFLLGLIRDNRVVWFFEETGLPYERIALDLAKGENKMEAYTQINGFQKVPTLDDNGFYLAQSSAILHYLAQKTGQLFPKEMQQQAKHLEWMFFVATDLENHAAHLKTLLPMTDQKDDEHVRWVLKQAETTLIRALTYLEAYLGEKMFLMGSNFYVADILLGCALWAIHDHRLVRERPRLQALLKRYYERPAFRRMMEVNGR